MSVTARRRFLAITAAAAVAPWFPARAETVTRWRGAALGAAASITLAHPRADSLIASARAEIARLDRVFSLYRDDSALVRLNRDGRLDAPPHELVDCLGIAAAVHRATGGAFDPTVQPLWAAHAEAWAQGRPPAGAEREAALRLTGWAGVDVKPGRIVLGRPGMALTLNGIAQGYIADRVARLLTAEGLDTVLIDTGELRALGTDPRGGDWTAALPDGRRAALGGGALATSAPLGTVFDAAGTAGHILDPRSGRPAPSRWRFVTVAAPSAAVADGLSTALCLLDAAAAEAAAAALPGARIVAMA
jgi:thiamine biosynthesis lipoprotein